MLFVTSRVFVVTVTVLPPSVRPLCENLGAGNLLSDGGVLMRSWVCNSYYVLRRNSRLRIYCEPVFRSLRFSGALLKWSPCSAFAECVRCLHVGAAFREPSHFLLVIGDVSQNQLLVSLEMYFARHIVLFSETCQYVLSQGKCVADLVWLLVLDFLFDAIHSVDIFWKFLSLATSWSQASIFILFALTIGSTCACNIDVTCQLKHYTWSFQRSSNVDMHTIDELSKIVFIDANIVFFVSIKYTFWRVELRT